MISMRTHKISYKLNIGLYFFCASIILVLLVTSTYYYLIREKLYAEIIDNLKSTVDLGAKTLDTEAFKKLVNQLPPKNLPASDKLSLSTTAQSSVESVESSVEFRRISEQLNDIRDTRPGLILYTYTLASGQGKNSARFVVDADLLNDLKNRTEENKNDEISPFGKVYDISAQPATQQALTERKLVINNVFVYDKEYKVNSIMGFAPIYDKKTHEFLGILGADISDANIATFLNKILMTSILITLAAIGVVTIMSVTMAGSVSRPITSMSMVVKRFSDHDLDARVDFDTRILEISNLITSFNFMADTIKANHDRLILLNASYERFVPVEFLGYLSKDNILQVQLGDQIQKDMVIMFSDIRSFTTLSEAMTPKQTFDFLNSYLQRVGPIIRRNAGFVDKYLGDGIMALFPKSPNDAINAAIEMRQELITYNQMRREQGQVEINTGVGLHVGTLMLGTIGEDKRMQGTVISDSVNLASRLESLTKVYGVSTLISKELFSRLDSPEKYHYRFLGNTNVKGKTESIAVFEIYDGDAPDVISKKDTIKPDFEKAVHYFATEEYAVAQGLFADVLEKYPEDKISDFYLQKCQDHPMATVA